MARGKVVRDMRGQSPEKFVKRRCQYNVLVTSLAGDETTICVRTLYRIPCSTFRCRIQARTGSNLRPLYGVILENIQNVSF